VTVAPDHLWRHFTPAGAAPIVIERAEGCHIYDTEGNRYLDALAALYCVNIGYGPYPEIAEVAREQLEKLPFFTNWVGFATPPALELTDKLSELVPIDVGRIFLVSGGSEAVEAALKVARQYHRLRGEPTRYKYVTRRSAYHGTTMGAISINGSRRSAPSSSRSSRGACAHRCRTAIAARTARTRMRARCAAPTRSTTSSGTRIRPRSRP
jgi:adenosylmethionine-8-amino-7-oxononanoate aminotransferase